MGFNLVRVLSGESERIFLFSWKNAYRFHMLVQGILYRLAAFFLFHPFIRKGTEECVVGIHSKRSQERRAGIPLGGHGRVPTRKKFSRLNHKIYKKKNKFQGEHSAKTQASSSGLVPRLAPNLTALPPEKCYICFFVAKRARLCAFETDVTEFLPART